IYFAVQFSGYNCTLLNRETLYILLKIQLNGFEQNLTDYTILPFNFQGITVLYSIGKRYIFYSKSN
ncbi:MAG: hypothetical protein DRR00_32975, partial [Candidatus Parabeggiatoa sp. nov. 3]